MSGQNSHRPVGTGTLVLTEPQTGGLITRRWRIDVVSGPDQGTSIVRQSGTIVVGASSNADFVLTDPSVSGYHAELRLLSEGVLAVDLNSRNGTRIGSTKIDRILMAPDSEIRVGRSRLRVSCVDERMGFEPQDGPRRFGDFVTCSDQMRALLAQLEVVATTDATVMLEGETGTGKELLARAIKQHSARAEGPFVVVDCGSVSSTLLESQLFGHAKGAFTGAVEDRKGAFEAANGGTLFLDELGELELALQPKLLRALEARTICRLGEVKERPVDVRFIAATHRDLRAMVKSGDFREDIYYRLAVVQCQIPPLRSRPEDIEYLALELVSTLSQGKSRLHPKALEALKRYRWNGNGRELRNVIQRGVLLSNGGEIGPRELLADESFSASETHPFHEAKDRLVSEFEKQYAKDLYARHQGNMSAAARDAGLSRNALYALFKRSGISPGT